MSDHRWSNFKKQMTQGGVCTNFAIQQLWIKECAEQDAKKLRKEAEEEGNTTSTKTAENKSSTNKVIERIGRCGFGDFSSHGTKVSALPGATSTRNLTSPNPDNLIPLGLQGLFMPNKKNVKKTPLSSTPSPLDGKQHEDLRATLENFFQKEQHQESKASSSSIKNNELQACSNHQRRVARCNRFFSKTCVGDPSRQEAESCRSLGLQRTPSSHTIDSSASGQFSLLPMLAGKKGAGRHYSVKEEKQVYLCSPSPSSVNGKQKNKSNRMETFLDDTAHRVLNKIKFSEPTWGDMNGTDDDLTASSHHVREQTQESSAFTQLSRATSGWCIDDELPDDSESVYGSSQASAEEDCDTGFLVDEDNSISTTKSCKPLDLMNEESSRCEEKSARKPEWTASLSDFFQQERISREFCP